MWYELLVMVLIAAGGTSFAYIRGARNIWLSLPFGLVAVVCIRMVTFAISYGLGFANRSQWVLFAVLLVGIAYALIRFKAQIVPALSVSTGAAAIAVWLARVFAIKPESHSDSSWILVMSHLFEQGGNIGILAHKVQFKRGFDYPLMLALGPTDEYLSAFTPYIYLAIVAAVIWAITVLVPADKRNLVRYYGGAVALVTFTTVVPLRVLTYINGHTLTAIGVTLISVASIKAIKAQELTTSDVYLIGLSVAVVSATRPEGILVSAIAMLPLLASKFIKRWQLAVLSSSATVTLSLWLILYNSYILAKLHVPAVVFYPAMILGGMLPWLKWFDAIRFRLAIIAMVSMVAVVVGAQIVFFKGMLTGDGALLQNLVFGKGDWGFLFIFLFAVFLIVGFKNWSTEYRYLVQISATLILSFLIAKMLDGGQSGHPDLGRVGWSDSLNRMWIHLMPLLLITAIVGLVERHGTKKLQK